MLNIGKLDRTVTIERKTETVSEKGAVRTAWTNIATVRAEIMEHFAAELATGFGEAEKGTVTFRTWFIDGITTADRVSYAGKVYDLKEIKEIGLRHGLELRAVAVS
jgi:head-tail adaptor